MNFELRAEGNWYSEEATLLGRRATPQETTEDHVDSMPIAAARKSKSEDEDDPVGYRMQLQWLRVVFGSEARGTPSVAACDCSD